MSYTYDTALRLLTYQATSSVLGGGFVRKAAYEYNADGSPKTVDNILDGRFDQAYAYDHLGRLTGTTSGLVTNSENEEVPAYSQMISYNAFGNMTSREAGVWGEYNDFTAAYTNNRKTGGNEVYDQNGSIIDKTTDADNYTRWKFDASGAIAEYKTAYDVIQGVSFDITNTLRQSRDGDGQIVKQYSERVQVQSLPLETTSEDDTEYFVRSTVLGQVLSELNADGEKVGTKVYVNGVEIAEQRTVDYDLVVWKHNDTVTGGRRSITQVGNTYTTLDDGYNIEPEPLSGGGIPTTDPFVGGADPENEMMPVRFKHSGNVFSTESGCTFHSARIECTQLLDLASSWGMKTLGGFIWFETPFEEYGLLDNESKYADALVNEGMRWRMFGNQIGILIGSGSTLNLVAIQDSGGGYQDSCVRTEQLPLGKTFTRLTLSETDCNFLLSYFFGDEGSIGASVNEPSGLLERGINGGARKHPTAGTNRLAGVNAHFKTGIHLYANETGTRTDAPAYIPSNPNGTAPKYLRSYAGFTSGEYEEKDNFGSYSNRFLFSYDNGLVILAARIAAVPDNVGERQKTLGGEFFNGARLTGAKNNAGSFQIGYLGGPGGGNGFYIHSHFSTFRNGFRVDPRQEFCSGRIKF